MIWLSRVNTTLSQWAAHQSWGRMVVLALVALIAGSLISETLNLRHDKVSEDDKPIVTNHKISKASERCLGDEIRIGGDHGIVICEKGRAKTAAASPDLVTVPQKPPNPAGMAESGANAPPRRCRFKPCPNGGCVVARRNCHHRH